jgi:hypothetical protein
MEMYNFLKHRLQRLEGYKLGKNSTGHQWREIGWITRKGEELGPVVN